MSNVAVSERIDLPTIRQLEAISFRAWPASHVNYNGSWLLRLSPQHSSKRLNSVNPLDPGDNARIPERVEALSQYYRENGKSPVFRLSPLAPPELDTYLEKQAWENTGATHVMVRGLADAFAGIDSSISDELSVRVETDIEQFANISMHMHGKKQEESGNAAAALASIIAHISLPKTMLVLELAGKAVASALIVQDGRWSGLLDIATRPDCQRQGFGRKLVQACLQLSHQQGSEKVWLQVEKNNIAALNLYEQLGFDRAYQYHYRISKDKE